MGMKLIQYNYSRLISEQLSMGFGYITDPDVGVGDRFYIFPSFLLIILISRPIFRILAPLFRLGRVSREAGGLEKNEAIGEYY